MIAELRIAKGGSKGQPAPNSGTVVPAAAYYCRSLLIAALSGTDWPLPLLAPRQLYVSYPRYSI